MTTIATLPAAPNKETDSAATFSSKANAWVAALPDFVTEANAVAGEVNAAAGAAADSETAAALEALAAAESAASAVNAPGTSATSATTMTPALGSKSFTLAQVDKNFVVGMHVIVAETTASSTNWMHGIVTDFVPGTGAMTIVADLLSAAVASAGDWTVALSGPVKDSSLGVAQTWQNFTAIERAFNTTHQNTTNDPIQVSVSLKSSSSPGTSSIKVNDTSTFSFNVAEINLPAGIGFSIPYLFVVPPSHYYRVDATSGITWGQWAELR